MSLSVEHGFLSDVPEGTVGHGLMILNEAFSKTRKIMEGCPDIRFTPEEYQRYYECVYFLCVQRTSSENANLLYDRYNHGLVECINSLVIPSLEDKNDAVLLTQLVVNWNNYKVMAKWLSRFFSYLDRFYIPRVGAPGLPEQSTRCFHSLVNERFKTRVIAAIISLINQDRNGEKFDRYLLKNVMDYFNVDRTVGGTCYDDLQKALFADCEAYYSQFASNGLMHYSAADYMQKAQWGLSQEEERCNHFIDPSSKDRFLQVAKSYVVDQALAKLAEKQQAENCGSSTEFQDLLSKCAGLNIGDPGHDPNWRIA